MEKRRDGVDVAHHEIRPKTPCTGPEESACNIIGGKNPPGHAQATGDDPVQLSEPVKKAGEENDHATAAREKTLERVPPLCVDWELLQDQATAPATDDVAEAIADRSRQGDE